MATLDWLNASSGECGHIWLGGGDCPLCFAAPDKNVGIRVDAPLGVDLPGAYLRRLDAALAEKDREIAEWQDRVRALESDNAALNTALRISETRTYIAEGRVRELELARFGDLTVPDLPDPPRRPDGTLAPQPKPLPVLKTAEPQRRVGG